MSIVYDFCNKSNNDKFFSHVTNALLTVGAGALLEKDVFQEPIKWKPVIKKLLVIALSGIGVYTMGMPILGKIFAPDNYKDYKILESENPFNFLLPFVGGFAGLCKSCAQKGTSTVKEAAPLIIKGAFIGFALSQIGQCILNKYIEKNNKTKVSNQD